MSDSDNSSGSSGEQSVARSREGFSVSASPFNGVKLELGVLVILGVLLSLVVERLFELRSRQIWFLVGYGALAMFWLVFRVQGILLKARARSAEGRDDHGQE